MLEPHAADVARVAVVEELLGDAEVLEGRVVVPLKGEAKVRGIR